MKREFHELPKNLFTRQAVQLMMEEVERAFRFLAPHKMQCSLLNKKVVILSKFKEDMEKGGYVEFRLECLSFLEHFITTSFYNVFLWEKKYPLPDVHRLTRTSYYKATLPDDCVAPSDLYIIEEQPYTIPAFYKDSSSDKSTASGGQIVQYHGSISEKKSVSTKDFVSGVKSCIKDHIDAYVPCDVAAKGVGSKVHVYSYRGGKKWWALEGRCVRDPPLNKKPRKEQVAF